MDHLDESEVVALRYDEQNAAEDLARWCGGQVEELVSTEDPSRVRVVIWVPGPDHPRAASPGDWIVRRPDGSFRPYTPEDFAARHEPIDGR